jgi:hypothetical protein
MPCGCARRPARAILRYVSNIALVRRLQVLITRASHTDFLVCSVSQDYKLKYELEDVEAELARTHSLLVDAKTELNDGKQVLVSPRALHLPA